MATKRFSFDVRSFKEDLERSVRYAANELVGILMGRMKNNLLEIDFKPNKVYLATSYMKKTGKDLPKITSDAARKQAVINSIGHDKIKTILGLKVRATVFAMKSNFKDSHIGIYYEHGTGEEWDGINTYIPNNKFVPNKYRTGREIVSRSKFIDYVGKGKGIYYDIGGNLRVTKCPRAGISTPGFKRKIGPDIEAHGWYRTSFWDVNLYKILSRYLKELNIAKYIKRPKKITL